MKFRCKYSVRLVGRDAKDWAERPPVPPAPKDAASLQVLGIEAGPFVGTHTRKHLDCIVAAEYLEAKVIALPVEMGRGWGYVCEQNFGGRRRRAFVTKDMLLHDL